jgi:hypothetical protein
MSNTIEDLKPKPFKVNVNGVELESKPLRLSHALTIAKIGNVFQDTANASQADIKQAEVDMDLVIGELIPELKGINLNMKDTIDLIGQLMGEIEPSDNKELREKGVAFDTDLKVGATG